tara:strand:- start:3002 stop:3379 length:378 start_codon:yes stop_codon:yes gene_type:complete
MTIRKKLKDIPEDLFEKITRKNVESRGSSKLRQSLDSSYQDQNSSHEVGVKRRGDNITDFNTQTAFWIIIVPIIIFVLLIVIKPTFVKMRNNDNDFDYSSVLLWTLIISLIIWILFWGFGKCRNC